MQRITYTQGNTVSVSVPLVKKTIEKTGNVTSITTEDYTPGDGDTIEVKLIGERRTYCYTPTMSESVAVFGLQGNEVAGRYGIEVNIYKTNGEKMRYAEPYALELVPFTGIVDNFVVGAVELGASVFFAMRGEKGDKGDPGEDGVGISSITKVSTQGLVDTYAITYTDGTSTTFQVTNGAKGEQGAQGIPGVAGADGRGIISITKTASHGLIDTYTITYTDGTTSTYQVTNGEDGQDAEDDLMITSSKIAGTDNNYSLSHTWYELKTRIINGHDKMYVLMLLEDEDLTIKMPYYGADSDAFLHFGADVQSAEGKVTHYDLFYGDDGFAILTATPLQDALVSGSNIKTINNTSLLGSGDITIPAGPQGPQGPQGNSGYSGAAGELEVVNNLTEGGATSALSAEQGKKLGDALFSETFNEEVRPYFAISTSATTIYKEGFYAVMKIPVTGDTKIVWKCGHSTANEVALTEYGSDNTRKAINRNATTDQTITLNAATMYINASFKSDYADAGIYKEDGTAIWIPNSVAGIKQSVERLEGGAPYDMVEDIDVMYTDGYVIGFDGAATALTDGRISDFIPVKAGETYKVGGNQHNSTPAYLVVCGYSSNDESTAIPTAFPFVLNAAACAVYNITIPTGVNYIRLSNYNRNGAALDALTSYKAFIGLRRYYKHDDALSNEVQSLKKSSGIVRDMWVSDGMYTNNTTGTYGTIKCFKLAVGTNVTHKIAIVPCSAGDRFTINTNTTVSSAVAFYDASLTRLWYSSAPYSSVLTAPANAVWLVLNLAAADTGNYVGADRLDGLSIWRGTQAQYDAMSSHDNNILYLIVE